MMKWNILRYSSVPCSSVRYFKISYLLPDDTRKRIENITAGIVIEGIPDTCTTIRNLLSAGFATSTTVKIDFEGKSVIKKEQAQLLEKYNTENNLWVTDFPGEDRFLTRGGEARVYLDKDGKNIIKVNDAVYYATWRNFLIVFFYTT